ncbi:hypothetical protein B0H17DRAFT_1077956 [Mycena rosella]|uniref:Uncharacterized protein n=1 Tax=Mycena rosella TaxID=1033263 RepID=A0AAD7D8C3_MYCRO|nr:hypothetical protein B0H17DRAFT_1077956 [Mycena rosella]
MPNPVPRYPHPLLEYLQRLDRHCSSTAALWAAIHIDFPRAEGFSQLLSTWLSRARNHPLSLSLRGGLTMTSAASFGSTPGDSGT